MRQKGTERARCPSLMVCYGLAPALAGRGARGSGGDGPSQVELEEIGTAVINVEADRAGLGPGYARLQADTEHVGTVKLTQNRDILDGKVGNNLDFPSLNWRTAALIG